MVLTYKSIILGNEFWTKVKRTPSNQDNVTYYLGKLDRAIDKLFRKRLNGEFDTWAADMQKKYGQKDADGNVSNLPRGGLPIPAEENKAAFDEEFDTFMNQEIPLEMNRLPLKVFFNHIQKTPMDWEILECIAEFSESDFEETKKPAAPQLAAG